MISPYDHGPGGDRPPPTGSTIWWAIRTVAVIAAVVLGCVGFTGAMQSATMQCHGVSYRGCATLVIADLSGKSEPDQ
jgi:hypothetical protein